MSKVTTKNRLDTLQGFIRELEDDLLNYYDLTDTQKQVVQNRISFLISYVERMKGEIEK